MPLYAFDGTWNDSSQPDDERDLNADTNVHQFRLQYTEDHHYLDGVGTRFGLIGKLIGGLTGAGAEARITEQFENLKANFKNNKTEIDIVGYSRGSAISRMFVHHIDECFAELELNGEPLPDPPKIRFLGLFDTVASFGVPWSDNEHGFKQEIPEFVQNTYHAMAFDETRETFGIERCLGNPDTITEVWFRGGHGDIGGNATYLDRKSETANRARSDLALSWLLAKATACGLPIKAVKNVEDIANHPNAPVTAKDEKIGIGNAGTLSRRIHLGDLLHHSIEITELTRGIDGRLLRRVDAPTRIEDEELEKLRSPLVFTPPKNSSAPLDQTSPYANPSLVELSSRRYPFDVLPARTWNSWMARWEINNPGITDDRLLEFWAPTPKDRALAWEVYVELKTRIATQELDDDEGGEKSALSSIYTLFPFSRKSMQTHGVGCANTATLITAFLNQKLRSFTTTWHKISLDEDWEKQPAASAAKFRKDLKQLRPTLTKLAEALSNLADARL